MCLCKTLPIMYSLPKMYKKPISARFILTSKNYITRALLKNIQNFENDL